MSDWIKEANIFQSEMKSLTCAWFWLWGATLNSERDKTILLFTSMQFVLACCASGGWSEQSTDAGQNTEVRLYLCSWGLFLKNVEQLHRSHLSLLFSFLQENHRNHKYEEVQGRNQEASSGGALSSVYALINCPADQLHYASVNFLKDSVTVSTDGNARADTGTNVSSLCVYSSVGGTPEGTRPPTLSSVSRPGEPWFRQCVDVGMSINSGTRSEGFTFF